jgi:predicted DNA-binding transcriptional regulator YafY
MSSGLTQREIVPFALVDTGLRWHVRAFDRKTSEFRDFVVTRIEAPLLLEDEPNPQERPDNDIQWTRIVELDFVPHPRLARPEIIRLDYGMADGSIRMRVRAAVAGYMLLRWGVDCSPDHNLTEKQYRLWLADPLALYGVENAKLAPGYRSPEKSNGRR